MNAMRAAALPAHRTEDYACPRPKLHVVYRAEGSLAVVAPPAAAPPVTLAPVAAPPKALPPKALPPKALPPKALPPKALLPAAMPPAAPHPVVAPLPAHYIPAAQPTPAEPAASPLRLTRRGRVVIAGLAVLVVAALSLLVAGAAQATSHAAPVGAAGHNLAQVAVRPSQSLWSVAESADPGADTRLVIQQILKLNALHGDTVFAGERLWVPRG
jgi:hypothetical protein